MQDLQLQGNDIRIQGGDMQLVESTTQHQRSLLLQSKGEWVGDLNVGVGLERWLLDDEPEQLLGELKTELEKDGMKVKKIQFLNDKINIDAAYT